MTSGESPGNGKPINCNYANDTLHARLRQLTVRDCSCSVFLCVLCVSVVEVGIEFSTETQWKQREEPRDVPRGFNFPMRDAKLDVHD
jgi:hypothetical protein